MAESETFCRDCCLCRLGIVYIAHAEGGCCPHCPGEDPESWGNITASPEVEAYFKRQYEKLDAMLPRGITGLVSALAGSKEP